MPIKWAVGVGEYYIYKKLDSVYVTDRANRPVAMGSLFHDMAGLIYILLTNTDSVEGAIVLIKDYMPMNKQREVAAIAFD